MKCRLSVLLLCLVLVMQSFSVSASEIEGDSEIVEYQEGDIHYLTEVLTRGSKKPSSSASTHDLSVNNYNYQLQKFGYQLFTDKWLTSDTGYISVSLSDFKTLEEYPGATKDQITFKLCDSSGVLVTSTKTVNNGSASVTWKNIKEDKKYYVIFQVPTNGNKYSGNGSISD